MLVLNNKKFAINKSEFVSSLFDASGTCSGFYKDAQGGIKLYDHQNKLRAFIVRNPAAHEYFVVSAHIAENKKTYYHFALSSLDEKWLGFDSLSYSAKVNAAKNISFI